MSPRKPDGGGTRKDGRAIKIRQGSHPAYFTGISGIQRALRTDVPTPADATCRLRLYRRSSLRFAVVTQFPPFLSADLQGSVNSSFRNLFLAIYILIN